MNLKKATDQLASPNPGLLAALLKTGRLIGVVRWKVNLSDEAAQVEASISNWSYFYLDTHGAKTVQDCVNLFATQLKISDLTLFNLAEKLVSLNSQIQLSNAKNIFLVWTGWQDVVANDLAEINLLQESFEHASQQWPGVVLIVDSKGQFPNVAELTSA